MRLMDYFEPFFSWNKTCFRTDREAENKREGEGREKYVNKGLWSPSCSIHLVKMYAQEVLTLSNLSKKRRR